MVEFNGDECWNVGILDETLSDISKIARFIEEKTNSEYYGKRFDDAATAVVESLRTFPYVNRYYSDDMDDHIRRVEIPGYKAAILYKTYDKELEVIAVMAFHTLKNPKIYNKIISRRIAIADAKVEAERAAAPDKDTFRPSPTFESLDSRAINHKNSSLNLPTSLPNTTLPQGFNL
jgi:plasmid stabilization system protein ParE